MIQRRAVMGIALVAAVLTLAACGFQSPDETAKEKTQIQGTNVSLGGIDVRDAFITAADASTPDAYLLATIVNDSKHLDILTGVTVGGGGSVTFSGPGQSNGQVALPPGVAVSIAGPTLRPTTPAAMLEAASVPTVGTTVPLQFTFANAGTTATQQVPVVSPELSFSPTQFVPDIPAPVPTQHGSRAND